MSAVPVRVASIAAVLTTPPQLLIVQPDTTAHPVPTLANRNQPDTSVPAGFSALQGQHSQSAAQQVHTSQPLVRNYPVFLVSVATIARTTPQQ